MEMGMIRFDVTAYQDWTRDEGAPGNGPDLGGVHGDLDWKPRA